MGNTNSNQKHKKHNHHRHHHHHNSNDNVITNNNVNTDNTKSLNANLKVNANSLSFAVDKNNTFRPHIHINGVKLNAVNRPVSTALTPSQLATYYGLNTPFNINSAPVTSTGKGIVVAVIDAYNYANAASDLTTFCNQYSLKTPNVIGTPTFGNMTNAAPTGTFNFGIIKQANILTNNASGWTLEQALDIQAIHSMAPDASILLIQATSPTTNALFAAVQTAINFGAHIISCSWGQSDSNSTVGDNTFNPIMGKFFSVVCSAGDSNGCEYPSTNPNVLAVGGTTLTLPSTEIAWGSSGGGLSLYQPTGNQRSVPSNKRCVPDVALDANPNSGFSVYCSNYSGGPWYQVGGTSLSAPLMAGLLALANQIRLSNLSKTALTDALIKNAIYIYNGTTITTIGTYFKDITSGGSAPYIAVSGWDDLTGLGSPKGANLVPYLCSL